MLEIIAYIVLGITVLVVLLAAFSVFISYVTQATYIDPLHDDDWDDR